MLAINTPIFLHLLNTLSSTRLWVFKYYLNNFVYLLEGLKGRKLNLATLQTVQEQVLSVLIIMVLDLQNILSNRWCSFQFSRFKFQSNKPSIQPIFQLYHWISLSLALLDCMQSEWDSEKVLVYDLRRRGDIVQRAWKFSLFTL